MKPQDQKRLEDSTQSCRWWLFLSQSHSRALRALQRNSVIFSRSLSAANIPWCHSCVCQTAWWPVPVWSWHSVPSADAPQVRAKGFDVDRQGMGEGRVKSQEAWWREKNKQERGESRKGEIGKAEWSRHKKKSYSTKGSNKEWKHYKWAVINTVEVHSRQLASNSTSNEQCEISAGTHVEIRV